MEQNNDYFSFLKSSIVRLSTVYLQIPPQLLMERKDAPTGPKNYGGEVSAFNITSTLNSVLGPRKYDRRLRPNFKRKLTVYVVTKLVN